MKTQSAPDHDFPACGYGFSGLCCSACLLGPCRISPFERDVDRAKCGASADRLVAMNLLRMIAAETAAQVADLAQIAQRVGKAAAAPRPAAIEKSETARDLLAKYGLDGEAALKAGAAACLAAEIKDLLDLNPSAPHFGPLWPRLYPVDIFPQFYTQKILPEASLSLGALSAFKCFLGTDASPQDLLLQCLKNSLLYMICDELMQDLEMLAGAGSCPEIPETESKAAEMATLRGSSEGIVLVSTPARGADGFKHQRESFCRQWRGPRVQISRPAGLFAVSRLLFGRQARRTAAATPLAIALTSSAALVVGILVCGYTTVSWPPLPFFGSTPAVRFFSQA